MPKALFLTDGLANGGAERQLALLVKYLPPEWERRVVSLEDGVFAPAIRTSGHRVDVCARQFRFDLRPAIKIARIILDWRPAVVHSWGWMSSMAAGPICKTVRISIVDSTIRIGARPPRRSRAQSLGMLWADRLIANSRTGLDAWQIIPARGRVIYNGFDPERFKLCVRSIRALDEPFTVVMTARMEKVKDYRTVIQTARKLTESTPERWRFLFVGDGADRANLIESANDLARREIVQFPEPCLEVINVLAQSDVGVLLSHPTLHAEGISNSIMEYMACGLPVVCSDSGGNRELVLDGETGFIIPPRDMNALVEKLVWFKEHPTQAAQMGQAGRERILTHFSVEVMVEKTVAVYREVL